MININHGIGEEFSGKINYTLNNGEKYEVYRDFNKKNPKIYNSNLEDVSKNYDIDKKDGNQFFVEQVGIDKQMYLSTVVSMQQEVKLDDKTQNMLVQKIANLAGTGDDNVSYKKAESKLQDKLKEEIGTNRTAQKPINIVQTELDNLERKIKEIEPYESKKFSLEEEKTEKISKINLIKTKLEIAKKVKAISDEQNIIKNKIETNKNKENTNSKKIEELIIEKNKLEENKKTNEQTGVYKKSNWKIKYIISLIIGAFLLLLSIIIKSIVALIVVSLAEIIIITTFIIKNKKIKEKNIENLQKKDIIKNEINNKIALIQGQITALQNENAEIAEELTKFNKEISDNLFEENEQIVTEYKNKVSEYEIKKILEKDNINNEIEQLEYALRDDSISLNKLELEENTILPQLDNLVKFKEKQSAYKEEYKELRKQERVINIALENLRSAYEEMKTTITPKFTENLSKNIDKISSGKYNKVTVNDEKGLIIENSNGEYIEANQLSTGTIDQLYLSLRLSMLNDLSKENLPIMLDESFAYFDEERLENILLYLSKELNEHQVIIFTCTNRETQILNKMNIAYNNIEL